MRSRWRLFTQRFLPAEGADTTFDILDATYSHPPRAYHNLTHIRDCLDKLAAHAPAAAPWVELSLWTHDCIYEPGRPDNEQRSAQIAGVIARELGFAPADINAARGAILATRHVSPPQSPEEAVVVDIDMSILAAEPGEYERYAGLIRTEFSFVPEEAFRAGRAAFLEGLLARAEIFHTPELRAMWEQPARANILREVGTLRA